MILVLSGTEDGKEIVRRLYDHGCDIITSVATQYGKSIFERLNLGKICLQGRLDTNDFMHLIDERGIRLLIDATHPYATDVSTNAIKACNEKGIKYIRYQRCETVLPESHLIHGVYNISDAVSKCIEVGKRVMLTTGFNNIKDFIGLNCEGGLVVRILPLAEHVRKSVEMGIHASNIAALQGPFSYDLNKALYDHFCIDTIVTKNSGKEGGVSEKVAAAIDNGINVVLIKRPAINYPAVYSSVDEIFDKCMKLESALG